MANFTTGAQWAETAMNQTLRSRNSCVPYFYMSFTKDIEIKAIAHFEKAYTTLRQPINSLACHFRPPRKISTPRVRGSRLK